MYDEDNHRLVVFGGRTAERKRLNDIWFLDLDKWWVWDEVWNELSLVNIQPPTVHQPPTDNQPQAVVQAQHRGYGPHTQGAVSRHLLGGEHGPVWGVCGELELPPGVRCRGRIVHPGRGCPRR